MKKLLLLLLLLPLLITPKVFAEKISSFDTNITVHENGLIDISEKINYDFEDIYRHGIYRYIPLYTKVGNLYRVIKISNVHIFRDGSKENFTSTASKEQVYFKIGNADKTITGPHLYEIDYTVENGIGSNFADHDEAYWNATGNGWTVDIEKASINFDTDSGAKLTKVLCFTGSFGSKASDCKVSDNKVVSNSILYSGEGLTGVVVYPVGTFPKSILYKELPKTTGEKLGESIAKNLWNIYLFLNFVLPIILIFWYKTHKNKNRFGKPSVNFDIPKDENGDRIGPALAGTIDNAKLDRNDVTATIFDLAIRKYIKLEGSKKVRKMMPDQIDQKIIKLKEPTGLNDYETTLYNRLFESGDSVDVKELATDFYTTYAVIEDKVFSTLKQKKYFVRNPKAEKTILIILGVVVLFMFNIFLGITLFYLSRKLIGRTQLGDQMDFKIDGLKLFLQKMDRNYNWQAEKFYTVEQMIPYAMALGYIDRFMEQLKIIKPNYNPSWYSGYSGSFYTSYGLFYSGLSSNMTTSAPSSSSGSGGGGFSGGGGGGGGGGSW